MSGSSAGGGCPSATTCEAVGYGLGGGALVPITDGTAGTPQAVSGTSALFGVACHSATRCEAVGYSYSLGESVVVTITNVPPGAG